MHQPTTPLTTQPFAQSPELNQVRSALELNIPGPERIGSAVAGAALLIGGASRRSWAGLFLALAGGALLLRGSTGHCLLYQQLGINSRKLNTETGVPGNKGIVAKFFGEDPAQQLDEDLGRLKGIVEGEATGATTVTA